MMRGLAGLVLGIALGAAAHADDASPIVGLLAPDNGGVAFHAAPGWQPSDQPLRVLDDAGRPLCCLRIGQAQSGKSDLQSGDAGRGGRYGVRTDGKLASRLAEGPILAPVLRSGVKVGQTNGEQTRLKEHDRNWTLERCVTQEGLRLTVSSTRQADKTAFYFPLGYDVEPSCR